MVKRFERALIARVLICLIAITSFAVLDVDIAGAATGEVVTPGISRIHGSNRFKTAIKVAQTVRKEAGSKRLKTIVVASGLDFPDALSGSYLAHANEGAILLVNKNNNNEVMEFISTNLAKDGQVYIMGGPSAVSTETERAIKIHTPNAERLSGTNRYKTNMKALAALDVKGKDIALCSGNDFPDAISVSAAGLPIMLVNRTLSLEQKKFLKDNVTDTSKVYLIGGTSAVSQKIENQVKGITSKYSRISGKTRYETSMEIAKTFFPRAKKAILATGEDFPDALSGSVLAKNRECPILLSSHRYNFQVARDYLKSKGIKSVTILGGATVVPDDATGLTKSGTVKTGFLVVGSGTYFVNGSQKIVKDALVKLDGNLYYAQPVSGAILKNGTIDKGGNTYYANAKGVLTKANKIIYLTFDDGPGPYTARLLDILDRHNAKATFFVTGNNRSYNYLIGRAAARGHAIGNHTYSHDYSYIYRSEANFWRDFDKTQAIIKEQTGYGTNLLRFPGGSSNQVSRSYSYGIMTRLAKQCSQRGYVYFDWNVSVEDAGGVTTSSGVYSNFVYGMGSKKVAVVLLHDVKYYTVDAVESILFWGERNGYVFLPLTTTSETAHHGIAN